MIKIPPKIINEIVANQENYFAGVTSPKWPIKDQVKNHFSSIDYTEIHFNELRQLTEVNKSMKILDLGCGYGLFVALLRKLGFNIWGCDIDKRCIEIGKKILKGNGIDPNFITVNTDRLPYADESIDFIYLKYVLGYVKNLEAFFKEINRVLKKGGRVYLITPNYQCCYDVNYGFLLIPWLPRWSNKIYVKLRRRRDSYINGLSFTTKRSLEKLFKENNLSSSNVGLKEWLKIIDKPDFFGRSQAVQNLLSLMIYLHLKPFFRFLAQLGFYTPLVYILRKE